MDFNNLLDTLAWLAKQVSDGYITMNEYRQGTCIAIVQYTSANFVYTGDIPVVA